MFMINTRKHQKKAHIFDMYQMSGSVAVVCNHIGSFVIITQQCLTIEQEDDSSKHICKTY